MLSMLPNPAMHDLRAMFRNWALSALTFLGRSLKRRWRMWLVTEAAYRRGDLFEKRGLKARSGILLLLNQHR